MKNHTFLRQVPARRNIVFYPFNGLDHENLVNFKIALFDKNLAINAIPPAFQMKIRFGWVSYCSMKNVILGKANSKVICLNRLFFNEVHSKMLSDFQISHDPASV